MMTRDQLVADLASAIQDAQDWHPLEPWPETYAAGAPTAYGILVAETTLDRLALLIEPIIDLL